MKEYSLNGIWSLEGSKQGKKNSKKIKIEAQVPGCVQLDLAENGYLPKDLYMGENIKETEKYEDYEWWYKREFDAPDERENVFLVFEGVDCLAEYFLNGEKLGESENMFISHEFNISKLLKDGKNTLEVHLKSTELFCHEADYTVNSLKTWEELYPINVRKAAHSFGWDIMPRAITSGLWRDVKIEVRDRIDFSQLYFETTDKTCTAYYQINCELSEIPNIEIELEGNCGNDSKFSVREKLTIKKADRIDLDIKNPKAWFPYGYGEPNLYTGKARLYLNGELIHQKEFSFGLRTVVLDRTDTTDGKNGKFRFLINGIEVMCKGTNWVPMDAFHSRDAARYQKALELLRDIGCNIVRCWGGNVYEDHEFFDFCDQNGIMVWQDFALACRNYPRDERFKRLITEEVASVVKKLRNHPSIILWAGDNEIDLVFYTRDLNPETNKITRKWIPEVLQLHDPNRPYLPSSPYICGEIFEKKALENLPESHLWGPRDFYKSEYYKESKSHFVSETGYHGMTSLESLKKFITAEKLWPYQNNSEWILHSSDQKGNDKRVMLLEKQIRQLFGIVPTEIEEYILASQISQAEADKYLIERMRVDRPYKTGILWWNLVDGWPQLSDAVVDYYYTKKLAYFYIKRSQAPFVIAAGEIAKWELPIFACNDTLKEKRGRFKVIDALTDEVIYESEFTADVNTSTQIASIPTYYSEQKVLIFEWEIDGEKGFNHYLCGFPPIPFDMYKETLKKYKLGE